MNPRYIIVIFSLFILTSCEFDYELDEIPYTKRMVVNSIISPDKHFQFSVKWSKRVDDPEFDVVSSGYELQLYESDKLLASGSIIDGSVAFYEIYPKVGQRYKIVIPRSAPESDIVAETYIPLAPVADGRYNGSSIVESNGEGTHLIQHVQVNGVELAEIGRAVWFEFMGLYQYKDELNDLNIVNVLSEDYYSNNGFIDQFNLEVNDLDAVSTGTSIYYSKAIRLQRKSIEKALPLNVSFSSASYMPWSIVMFEDPYWAAPIDIPISAARVDVISPSDEYDKYMKSAIKYNILSADPSFPIFSSPIEVYSNIENGLGIFAGYNSYKLDFKINR